MALRLDPRLPMLWRSPQSLQFGLDNPSVVLAEVSGAQERMIAALVKGISPEGLAMVCRSAGGSEADADRLLDTVRPALAAEPTDTATRHVTVVGGGSTAGRLSEALSSQSVRVTSFDAGAPATQSPADLTVIVAHFVIEPEYYGLWLRRDQVHLPLVYGDASVRIGPLVEPGVGPCLYCLERTRTDADPAWPAIASQLWGRRSALDGGLVAGEVSAVAARMVLTRLERASAGPATSITIDAHSGHQSTVTWARHPECGCAALPGSERAYVSPSDSAPAPTS